VIHGYLDGELDLVRSLAVEQHLKDCPVCAQAHREQQALRAAVAGGSLYFNVPKGLEKRVRSAVRQASRAEARAEGRHRPWNWNWPTILYPIAAAALVLIIAQPIIMGRSGQNRLIEEIVSAHVRSVMADTSHLTDVSSSDRHTVKPWFTGKLPFSPPVTDLSAQGFPLIGGRLDYVGDRPVAALVYQRRQHWINLFIWPLTRDTKSGEEVWTQKGYHIIHWTEGSMACWAVSDVSLGDLRLFQQLARAGTPPG